MRRFTTPADAYKRPRSGPAEWRRPTTISGVALGGDQDGCGPLIGPLGDLGSLEVNVRDTGTDQRALIFPAVRAMGDVPSCDVAGRIARVLVRI